MANNVIIGTTKTGGQVQLLPVMANRHGLVAGATGTGKTVTLQTLAEQFSALGVPVFLADVKGDLSGLAAPATLTPKLQERLTAAGITSFTPSGCPVIFWDLYGKKGLPVRTTISEMGPLLLARLLDLNDTQSEVLQVVFRVADEQGLLLLDLKDLRAMLASVGEHAAELRATYGNIAPATIGTIQRSLLTLEEAGTANFFAEPALQLPHLMQKDFSGHGVVSIFDATTLMNNPRLYATFLLWLLSELFEQLDEVGDLPQPRLALFFDEAHLLFRDMPDALLEKIEQVVRLIRSKGVSVWFVTQNPLDIPARVLAQLGNRVQHALRAFTPADQKVVGAVAGTFRANPALATRIVITELAVGEALASLLDAQGAPTPVERVMVRPPASQIGPLAETERARLIANCPLAVNYATTIDRESAFEQLQQRASQSPAATPAAPRPAGGQTAGEALLKSAVRAVGSSLGRQIVRGILGGLFGSRRR